MKGFKSETVEAGNAKFTLYELNGQQRLDHLDELRDLQAEASSDSPFRDFLRVDLEMQWSLVTCCLKGPRWWVPKWYCRYRAKRVGLSVLSELYLKSCILSNIPTPQEVSEAEKKAKPLAGRDFCRKLALQFNQVRFEKWLRAMPCHELDNWAEHYRKEPFGYEIETFRQAQLCALTANGLFKPKNPFKHEEFVPKFDSEAPGMEERERDQVAVWLALRGDNAKNPNTKN